MPFVPMETASYEDIVESKMLPFPDASPDTTATPESSSDSEAGEDMEERIEEEGSDFGFFGRPKINRGYPLPPRPEHFRTLLLCYERPLLTGMSLAGNTVFTMDLEPDGEDGFDVQAVHQMVAEALGEKADAISLLKNGEQLPPSQHISSFNDVMLRLAVDLEPVFMCRRGDRRYVETELGEAAVDIDENRLFGSGNGLVQAIQERRELVTGRPVDVWLVYTKLEVFMYGRPRRPRQDLLHAVGVFPQAPTWKLPPSSKRWGTRCDVWSCELNLPKVKDMLDNHAQLTADRPIPRYQMIVDPNRFVVDTNGPCWVPCEFDIDADGSARLIGGVRSHRFPQLAEQVATPILTAALPLLAKLRRPQLLLPGRRLQAVFKAQRIILPPARSEDDESEYIGLWHVDGHREDVVAVVLYYYHVDASLRGGDMEFCGREPLDVLGIGDCDNNASRFDRQRISRAFRGGNGKEQIVENCRVPIKQGTLLVFSNYQMVHRVLRLLNTSPAEASRDFVALFILNPAQNLVPSRCALARPYVLQRTLQSKHIGPTDARRVLEFAGELLSCESEEHRRDAMLLEQLQPSGKFVGMQNVHSTGNGCFTMVGWLHSALRHRKDSGFMKPFTEDGWKCLSRLNKPPSGDRGLSAAFSQKSENDTDLSENGIP